MICIQLSGSLPPDGAVPSNNTSAPNLNASSIFSKIILNQRIEAQKKYKIESTPTIIVNEKKYLGKVNYESFKKIIEKNL